MNEKSSLHLIDRRTSDFLKHKPNIIIWTDGGCRKRDRATGWVVVAVGQFGSKNFSEILAQGATYLDGTSSSLAIEIHAAVEALSAVVRSIETLL